MRYMLTIVCYSLLVSAFVIAPASAQALDPGRGLYTSRCAGCHGTNGGGGELGPSILTRVPARTDEELAAVVRHGLPASGMPAFANVSDADLADLVKFLRTLKPRDGATPTPRTIALDGGGSIAGIVMNEGPADLQLLGQDRKIHLFRRAGNGFRPVTSQTDWPSYNGATHGSRYSALSQITRSNVARLAPKWIFSLPNTSAAAGDAGRGRRRHVRHAAPTSVTRSTPARGREIWHYQRPRTRGLIGNAAGGINRGVAVAGDRVFMVTDHAHIIALNRVTGALLWETEMADWRQNYNATGAPLVVGNLVVAGTSGGDEGVRGFLAAYDQATGKEVWRFWTVPNPGEPGSETWQGQGIAHPGAATWLTGTYDPELDTLYWPTGNPAPDYTATIASATTSIRIRSSRSTPKTGKLKWHFQFTPHDVWDYDAQETPALDRCRSGRASRASCWCRPIATGSSTCSIARTASSCSARST